MIVIKDGRLYLGNKMEKPRKPSKEQAITTTYKKQYPSSIVYT